MGKLRREDTVKTHVSRNRAIRCDLLVLNKECKTTGLNKAYSVIIKMHIPIKDIRNTRDRYFILPF